MGRFSRGCRWCIFTGAKGYEGFWGVFHRGIWQSERNRAFPPFSHLCCFNPATLGNFWLFVHVIPTYLVKVVLSPAFRKGHRLFQWYLSAHPTWVLASPRIPWSDWALKSIRFILGIGSGS